MFLWTLRMQCWQTRRNLSDKKKKFFCLRFEVDPIEYFFSKRVFFRQKFSMHTWSAVLTTPPKIYRQKAEIVPLIIPKPKEIWFSRINCFSSFSSHGHEEYSLDNAPKKLSITDQQHFTHCPKTIKNTISLRKKCFLSRCSSEHLECSVGKPIGKSLTKRRTIFANFLEKIWKTK